MRSMFSGRIKSSGPSLDINLSASSTPVIGESPAASQRRAISAQVIALALPSVALSPFAFSTTLSVIGRRGGGAAAPRFGALLPRLGVDQRGFSRFLFGKEAR